MSNNRFFSIHILSSISLFSNISLEPQLHPPHIQST
nr:MAG TPA: hypothetical protein [Caudoviricetes sp.]